MATEIEKLELEEEEEIQPEDTIEVDITDEANFDYVCMYGIEPPEKDIKDVLEEYIKIRDMAKYTYYFRVKYYDETLEEMLMLFIYKGEVVDKGGWEEQHWEVRGICPAEDWCQELEDCGQIRAWLSTKINPEDTGDWVWDERVREEKRQKEIEEWLNG